MYIKDFEKKFILKLGGFRVSKFGFFTFVFLKNSFKQSLYKTVIFVIKMKLVY